MKKNIFLVAIMAFVGMANAQMVKPTELVSTYSSFDGQNIAVSDFTGSIRGLGAVSANSAPVNPVIPTTASTIPLNTASGASTGNTTSTAPKVRFCKILKGYKIVDFTATGSESCGCFYIPTNMVTKFQDIQKMGAKMMVRVDVNAKSKVNKITGLDSY
jgi:hypothetical protein